MKGPFDPPPLCNDFPFAGEVERLRRSLSRAISDSVNHAVLGKRNSIQLSPPVHINPWWALVHHFLHMHFRMYGCDWTTTKITRPKASDFC